MKSRKNVKGEELSGELLEGQSQGLLKELHLLTRDGQLNADARRKLKQVNHLYNLIRPALDDLISRHASDLTIIDVGAGKAYLGFILYDLALKNLERSQILSIESRPELVTKGQDMAKRLGFERMKFIEGKIEESAHPSRVHLVTALHACDTATDDALILGIKARADYIAVVPCCQAEVAQLLKEESSSTLSELWRHGIHRREFGSHLTNVLRTMTLEALGYQVSVTELVGWEHSLKNEFILAKRVQNENPKARLKLDELVAKLKITPKLLRHFGISPQ